MKKFFLSFFLLGISSPGYSKNLLEIENREIIFSNEALKKFTHDKINELLKLYRQDSGAFKSAYTNVFEKTNIFQDNEEKYKQRKESAEDKYYQEFMWYIMSKLSEEKIIDIPDFRVKKNKITKTLKNKIKTTNFSSLTLRDLKDFFNSPEVTEERKKANNSPFAENLKTTKTLFYVLENTASKFFMSCGIKGSFHALAVMAFREAIYYYVSDQKKQDAMDIKSDLKLSDIFDIMMYIRHRVVQFDRKTVIDPNDELKVKESMSHQFAFYRKDYFAERSRRKFFEGKQVKAETYERYEKNVKKIIDKFFPKNIKQNVEGVSEKKNVIRKIFLNYCERGEKKDIDLMQLSLKDLTSQLKKDSRFSDIKNFSEAEIFYTIYLAVKSMLKEDDEIFDPLKLIGLNIFFEKFSHQDIEKISLYDMANYAKFIQKKGKTLSNNYGTAFHEAAHAYIAIKHDIEVNFASCIEDNEGSQGWISPGKIKSLWIDTCIDVAGILGDFLVSRDFKDGSTGASSDFKNAYKNIEKIYENVKNNDDSELEKEIPNYEKLSPEERLKAIKAFKDKIEGYAQSGLNMLETNEDLGKPKLKNFLTQKLWEKIKKHKEVQNIIAACIVENFNLLSARNKEGKKIYEILVEKLFDKGSLDREEIMRYVNEFDNDKFMETYIHSSHVGTGIEKGKKNALLLHDNRQVKPLNKISKQQEIDQHKKDMEAIAKIKIK